jgi:hypothetical protein
MTMKKRLLEKGATLKIMLETLYRARNGQFNRESLESNENLIHGEGSAL